MLFQSSVQYFYKAVMHFHFTCSEGEKGGKNGEQQESSYSKKGRHKK